MFPELLNFEEKRLQECIAKYDKYTISTGDNIRVEVHQKGLTQLDENNAITSQP